MFKHYHYLSVGIVKVRTEEGANTTKGGVVIRPNGCAIVRNVESLSALIANFNDPRR